MRAVLATRYGGAEIVTEARSRWQARDLVDQREKRMSLYGSLASPCVARVVPFSKLKGFGLEPQMPEGGIKSAACLDAAAVDAFLHVTAGS
jgi:hypothetical protein